VYAIPIGTNYLNKTGNVRIT